MSYIVLARKYRPQSFPEVYAQEHVTQILQSAIESKRIAHAYLFTGPRGVGKTSMARIMAKSLNCLEGPSSHPCNVCSNCTEITAGTSPDVIEIDGASNTGVDDIRELQRELLYAASSSLYKIYIIDEVHMLSKNAFNALLKTLEEPPENVVFIFATTEPQKVLATIISRCQRYDFKRIPIEAIVERLKDICAVENIRIDSESLYLIARKADGGMRDALSLMDQAISYCVNDITIDKVRQIFGLIPNQVFQRFFQLIDAKDAPALIRELHLVFEQGTDLQEFLVNLLEFIRVLILRKLGVQTQDINPDELAAFDELGTLFSQNKLLYILSMLIASRADLKSSSNPYLLLEALMIKLCKLDEMEDLAAMINNLGTAGPIANPSNIVRPNPSLSRPLPASVVPPEPPMQSREEPEHIKQDFNEENLATLWPRILVRTKKISNMCSLALDSSKQRAVQGKHLSLSLESQTNYNLLKSNLDKLHEIFSELFHNKVQISLKLLEVEPPTKVHIRRRTLEDLKQESPEVARFAELTDAILVPSP